MSNPFIGEILMFGGNFNPRGWSLCDGQLLQINNNSALFAILGTTYGGDGRTTFGLPDLRGRASKEGDPLLRFVNVCGALVRGCVAPRSTNVFLEVNGRGTRDVTLTGNVLKAAEKPLLIGSDVRPDAVRLLR